MTFIIDFFTFFKKSYRRSPYYPETRNFSTLLPADGFWLIATFNCVWASGRRNYTLLPRQPKLVPEKSSTKKQGEWQMVQLRVVHTKKGQDFAVILSTPYYSLLFFCRVVLQDNLGQCCRPFSQQIYWSTGRCQIVSDLWARFLLVLWGFGESANLDLHAGVWLIYYAVNWIDRAANYGCCLSENYDPWYEVGIFKSLLYFIEIRDIQITNNSI